MGVGMIKIAVDSLTGTETAAKEIATTGGLVLIPPGMKIKMEYKARLQELGISYIYVEETGENVKTVLSELLPAEEERIKAQCRKTVVETLEKFSYLGTTELSRIKEVAEEIISDIMEEPEVLYSVSGIRSQSDLIYEHSLNVCGLAVLLSLKMKLPRKKVEQIAVGSLLHDIGYVYVAGDFVQKREEELDPKERIELKKHVIYGYEAIQKESWLSATARNIILYHHEALDGSGYPFHLSGNKIKTESRIVAVCDLFDRLVYGVFCKPMKVHRAVEEIIRRSETKLDFNVIRIFQESVASYPNGSKVITNDGGTGIVIRQKPKCPTRPVLRMLSDGKEIDLTEELNIVILDTVT